MDYKRLLVVFAVFFSLSLFVVFTLVKTNNKEENQTEESDSLDELLIDESLTKDNLAAANERKALEEENSDANILTDDNEEVLQDKDTEVSLILSSVAKDIRIRVMSDEGVIEDVAWVLDISDEEGNTYQVFDEDRDGLVHVSDINAGRYFVKVEPEPGFVTPEDKVPLSVRDQISYTAIPDISFEIKTEDQIDAEKEDTAISEETDNGTVEHPAYSEGIRGIDVSKWNKEIDWNLVASSGIEYAIIRCGYRGSSTGALVLDPYWDFNFNQARASGIKVGVYFFSQAMNETEAVEEASMVLSLLNNTPVEYPIFIDVEGSGGRADILDNNTRTEVIKAFCKTIDSAGYESGVYANKNWFTNKINTAELSGINKWLAQYNVLNPTYEGDYNIWQYTSKGSVNGIEGNVDLNISYVDY